MRHLLLVSIALAVSTPALARPSSAIPQFDAAQICHATSNLGLGDDQSFATCMRDETEAKNQLAKDWTNYAAEVRSRCSAETRIGGSPSYVELSTCLDMDKSVTELERPIGPSTRAWISRRTRPLTPTRYCANEEKP